MNMPHHTQGKEFLEDETLCRHRNKLEDCTHAECKAIYGAFASRMNPPNDTREELAGGATPNDPNYFENIKGSKGGILSSKGWEEKFDELFINLGTDERDFEGAIEKEAVKSFIRSVESRAREEEAEQYRGLGALTRSEAVRLRLSAEEHGRDKERERVVKVLEGMKKSLSNVNVHGAGGQTVFLERNNYNTALSSAIEAINK